MPKTLRLHPDDNVVIALAPVSAPSGAEIPSGHKLASCAILKGQKVRKYGQVIGAATADIAEGVHVHSHNLGMDDHKQVETYGTQIRELPTPVREDTFQGYHRASGRVGTRNYVGILTSVNCAGSVARFIAEATYREGLLDQYPNVDGIVPIAHSTGCGMSAQGEGYDTLFRTISGYARNPNFGAILMLGLGCEVMQLPKLAGTPQLNDPMRFRFMTIQQTGGTRATVDKGLAALHELMAEANRTTRMPAPASALTVGMQCGGSDGLSGITANPALGHASDLLVAQGGTTILSETSEIFGAEHLLTSRARTPAIGAALEARLAWWEDYCVSKQRFVG